VVVRGIVRGAGRLSLNYLRHALVLGGWLAALRAFSLIYRGRGCSGPRYPRRNDSPNSSVRNAGGAIDCARIASSRSRIGSSIPSVVSRNVP